MRNYSPPYLYSVSVILDLEVIRNVEIVSADVCVIGAGAAGITMALELSRGGATVIVLEAGGLRPEQAGQDLFRSDVVGLPHKGIHEGRVRAFGGTTTQWGGQILELNKLDFELRPWIEGSGWPITKSDLLAGYAGALAIEGVASSFLHDDEVWKNVGTNPPPFGPDLETFFTRWCPQPDFAKLYGDALASDSRITLYLHAAVCEFILSDTRDAMAAVRCRTLGGREVQFESSSFVICVGALETARLLLQPLGHGDTPPWNSSGTVGRFFQDHLDVTVATLIPYDRKKVHLWADNIYLRGFRYVPKLRASAGFQQQFETLAIGASYQFRSARQDAAEVKNVLNRLRRGQIATSKEQSLSIIYASDVVVRKAWRFYRHHRAYNPDDLGIEIVVHCEQAPDPRSRLTLSNSRDALGMFRSQLDWRIGEMELDSTRKFTEFAARQFESAGIAQLKIHSETLRNLGAFTNKAADSYHHMGTARMSISPRQGVVDADCKLHGIRNGFVCGSAVFPTSGFSNPTHTILALGIRLAGHLSRVQYCR